MSWYWHIILDKQKKFREEANFCKVSFREYDEQVCDITKYVQKYWNIK